MRENRRVAHLTIARAIDEFLAERSGETARTYRRILNKLADTLPDDTTLPEITTRQCRAFLGQWASAAPATRAQYVSCLRTFFAYFHDEDLLPVNPMARVKRPRRPRPQDLDVVTVSTAEAHQLLAACETWQEFLCITVLLFIGMRRRAASRARLRDVDFQTGMIRLREKGRKVLVKPVPDQLLMILELARQEGIWACPDDYLIPSRRRPVKTERSHKVIYDTVVKVAGRAGVRAHVHSLRAAYAVQFLETHGNDTHALKELLGHDEIATTYVYLRRADRSRAMESVRDLRWGGVLPPSAEVPRTGFEPVLEESFPVRPVSGSADGPLPDPLRAKLDELSEAARRKARS